MSSFAIFALVTSGWILVFLATLGTVVLLRRRAPVALNYVLGGIIATAASGLIAFVAVIGEGNGDMDVGASLFRGVGAFAITSLGFIGLMASARRIAPLAVDYVIAGVLGVFGMLVELGVFARDVSSQSQSLPVRIAILAILCAVLILVQRKKPQEKTAKPA